MGSETLLQYGPTYWDMHFLLFLLIMKGAFLSTSSKYLSRDHQNSVAHLKMRSVLASTFKKVLVHSLLFSNITFGKRNHVVT